MAKFFHTHFTFDGNRLNSSVHDHNDIRRKDKLVQPGLFPVGEEFEMKGEEKCCSTSAQASSSQLVSECGGGAFSIV